MRRKTGSLSVQVPPAAPAAPIDDLQELADDVAGLIAGYGLNDAERRELLRLLGGEVGR